MGGVQDFGARGWTLETPANTSIASHLPPSWTMPLHVHYSIDHIQLASNDNKNGKGQPHPCVDTHDLAGNISPAVQWHNLEERKESIIHAPNIVLVRQMVFAQVLEELCKHDYKNVGYQTEQETTGKHARNDAKELCR